MKQLFFIALFVSAGLSLRSATLAPAPDFVVITDGVVYLTANEYMSATYVTVSLLDKNGNVQATATTSAGGTVAFTLNNASRKVRSVYHMDSGQEFVIMDEDLQ